MSETETDNTALIEQLAEGEFEYVAIDRLNDHPVNKEVYGKTNPPPSFVDDIERKGVETPVVVNEHEDCPDTIIGGHRRTEAARRAGFERVPVRWVSYPEPEATLRVIHNNKQRDKTDAVLTREAHTIESVARKHAKQRQGTRTDIQENFPESVERDSGEQSRDRIAETVGVSGRTLEKGLNVHRYAYPDEYVHDDLRNPEKYVNVSEDVREVARQQVEAMDADDPEEQQSFHGAYETVKDVINGGADDANIDQFTSQQTDEWSSPPDVVRPLSDAIGGFDLDPCSGAEQSPFADETFTEDDDGLRQHWFGSVWVNPPYSDMRSWVDEAVTETLRDEIDRIVFLCKGDSSTNWWQKATYHASLITAIDGRLSFGDGENAAPFPSHILVFGDVTPPLVDALRDQGTVLTVGWDDE